MNTIKGQIVDYDGEYLKIRARYPNWDFIIDHKVKDVDILLNDGVHISNEQRRKIYATFRDIAEYRGYDVDDIKLLMKTRFAQRQEIEDFSLSDMPMTLASEFTDYILDWCLECGVPLSESATSRCEDIEKYAYSCLMHKRCCICGGAADLHHVDTVGMGGDRANMHHRGLRAMALCRVHHNEIHNSDLEKFYNKYHVVSVPITEKIARRYKLNY